MQVRNGENGTKGASHSSRIQPMIAITALGVVFGDIGTSPLYALRECFYGSHSVSVTPENVYGVLSLIFWSMMIIISVKYMAFIMRADNRGEGGILALVALACVPRNFESQRARLALMSLGLFGATLLYGDGMITPAISVLSAVEGLKIATPVLESYVLPITVVILFLLFSVQRFGTARIGAIFGPVMLVWFTTLGLLGLGEIIAHPQVLVALNPLYAVEFFFNNGLRAYVILGSVFLSVTGGEALYADMGHFGRIPIRHAWFLVALPGLLLNYFGQGAFLIANPSAAENPFYQLAPSWALYPLVALATMATVTASQALISGVFSLTRQAVQLGYSPRLNIIHTSRDEIGQIYVPTVNWSLLIGTIWLVLTFRSSSEMAAAYGIAVCLTMSITTVFAAVVAKKLWKWNLTTVLFVFGVFLFVDAMFLSANLTKILHGGWVPLIVAFLMYIGISTWIRGRQILATRLRTNTMPIRDFLQDVASHPLTRVPGTAVFMTGSLDGTPLALLHNIKHNKVLHERVIFLTVVTEEVAHVTREEHIKIDDLGQGFYRIIAHFGFMDDPNVSVVLKRCAEKGLNFELRNTTFFLGRESVLATKRPGMAIWREKLFAFMARNAQNPTSFFRIPPDQVIEVGMQVEL